MARLNGEISRFHPITLSHSTYQCGSVGFRDDVGIVPYNHDEPHSIQHTTPKGGQQGGYIYGFVSRSQARSVEEPWPG